MRKPEEDGNGLRIQLDRLSEQLDCQVKHNRWMCGYSLRTAPPPASLSYGHSPLFPVNIYRHCCSEMMHIEFAYVNI